MILGNSLVPKIGILWLFTNHSIAIVFNGLSPVIKISYSGASGAT